MGRFASGDLLQRSESFALRAIRLVRTLPRDVAGRHVGEQFLRCATSVGANLSEADMADSTRDFCAKVNIAQKEAGEAAYWLALMAKSQMIPGTRLREIEQEARELRGICRRIVYLTRAKAAGHESGP
jgi:four helix bundle protein